MVVVVMVVVYVNSSTTIVLVSILHNNLRYQTPLVGNLIILLQQSFTAHVFLLMAARTFGLWKNARVFLNSITICVREYK